MPELYGERFQGERRPDRVPTGQCTAQQLFVDQDNTKAQLTEAQCEFHLRAAFVGAGDDRYEARRLYYAADTSMFRWWLGCRALNAESKCSFET
jgi:hypothetical protein